MNKNYFWGFSLNQSQQTFFALTGSVTGRLLQQLQPVQSALKLDVVFVDGGIFCKWAFTVTWQVSNEAPRLLLGLLMVLCIFLNDTQLYTAVLVTIVRFTDALTSYTFWVALWRMCCLIHNYSLATDKSQKAMKTELVRILCRQQRSSTDSWHAPPTALLRDPFTIYH